MDNMLDPFNNPPTGAQQPTPAPRPPQPAQQPGPPPQQPMGGMLPQDVQNMIVSILTDYDNQRRQEDEQRHAEQVEEIRKVEAMARRVEQAEPVRASPIAPRVYAETPIGKSREDYKRQFEEEDKVGVPLAVADRPFSPMEKEPIAIITALLTVAAAALPWFGIVLTQEEVNLFATSIGLILTSVITVVGAVSGIIMRSKVNSPATVKKAKQEGKL